MPVLKQCLDRCGYFIGAEKDYWQAHMQLYIAHRLARRSEIEQGLIAADTAISLFIEFEARIDYPDCLPIDLIQYYGAVEVDRTVNPYVEVWHHAERNTDDEILLKDICAFASRGQ